MRKGKVIIASLSAAALIVTAAFPAYAQETETEAAATETAAAADETVTLQTEVPVEVTGEEISVYDRDALVSYAEQSIDMLTGMTDDELHEILKPSSILSIPQKSVVQSAQSWSDNREELGAFQSIKSHKLIIDDDMITVESTCDFANAEGIITTVLDRDTLSMDSMSFSSADSSFGKVMEEAALNTLMGLGIVFLTLLFLSFLISQFKHIAKLEKAATKKADTAPAAAPAAPAAVPAAAPVEETADDGELIAVIAAAVAAYEGTTTDGFVVRSIKKKNNRNKWQRA